MLHVTSHGSAGPRTGKAGVCPGCGRKDAEVFFEQPKLPVHCNILWETPEAARCAPTGSMRLAVCPDCGLLFNAAFDPQLVTYDATYENSLHYSPTFEAYAAALAEDLSDRHRLRDRLVVEVGCGKGDFLRRLCLTSGARGLGIDASYDPAIVADTADDRVQFVREPFSAMPPGLEAALVFCRHVLEHVPDPHGFVSELAAGASRSSGCRVLIEVPNALYTLRDLGIWDLIYEHCSYFSAPSLTRLCERAGLRVERAEAVYGNQFLCVEATVGAPSASLVRDEEVRDVRELAAHFREEYARKVDHWARRLQELGAAGKSVALWGAGSKGITFVNTVPGGNSLACLVDLNPRKQGRFVPGTGQPVVSPEALATIAPDLIVVMNPLYRDEVGQRAAQLGLSCPIEAA